MRLKNTSPLPDAIAREILRFVMPPGVTNVRVTITNSRPGGDRGRGGGHKVLVRLSPWLPSWKLRGYVKWPSHQGYIGSQPLCCLTECAVYLLAHELRHCWQSKVKSGHRVWGSRGKFSERDADAYAINAVRRWRREHPLGGKRDTHLIPAPE